MAPPDDRHHHAQEFDAVQINGDGSFDAHEYSGPQIEEVRKRLNNVLMAVLPGELSRLLQRERNAYDYLFFRDNTLDHATSAGEMADDEVPEVTDLTYKILNIVRNDIIHFIQNAYHDRAKAEKELYRNLGCLGLPFQVINKIKSFILQFVGQSDINTTEFDDYFREGSFLNVHLRQLISERFRCETSDHKAKFIMENAGFDRTYGHGFLAFASPQGAKAIVDQLSQWPERSERYSIFIDLDFFGPLNKEWDSNMGDLALRHAAKICSHFASKFKNNILIRYGGEEMGIVIQGSKEEVCILAEKIRIAMQDIPLYAINEVREDGKVDDDVLPISISGNRYEAIMKEAPALIESFGTNGFYLNQEVKSEKDGHRMIRGIRSLIPDPDNPNRKILISKLPTTASVGVAEWPDNVHNPEDIQAARAPADRQSNVSKKRGRNKTYCDDQEYQLPGDFQFSGISHLRIAPPTNEELQKKFASADYITSKDPSDSES